MSESRKMRVLVVEDDFGGRRYLQMLLRDGSRCDVVVDGQEAIDAFSLGWEENDPYKLILLDIMMPNVDGQTALREIRNLETKMGVHPVDAVKVIMTTALDDPKNVVEAYSKGGADSYIVKPIDHDKLFAMIRELGLPID